MFDWGKAESRDHLSQQRGEYGIQDETLPEGQAQRSRSVAISRASARDPRSRTRADLDLGPCQSPHCVASVTYDSTPLGLGATPWSLTVKISRGGLIQSRETVGGVPNGTGLDTG